MTIAMISNIRGFFNGVLGHQKSQVFQKQSKNTFMGSDVTQQE